MYEIPNFEFVEYQRAGVMVDVGQADPLNMVFMANEKVELQSLNDRFASYIEKVRFLKQQKQRLTVEVEQLRSKRFTRIDELYEKQMKKMKEEVKTVTEIKSCIEVERDNLRDDVASLKHRLHYEINQKKMQEEKLDVFRKDLDTARLARLELDRYSKTLQEDIEFLKKVHKEKIHELQESQKQIQVDMSKTDFKGELVKIRAHYEEIIAKNASEADNCYRSKMSVLQQDVVIKTNELKQARQETNTFKHQIENLTCEINRLVNANASLVKQMRDMKERHEREVHDIQETVTQLEKENVTIKTEAVVEYQKLHTVKERLDVEIATYRRLLEAEESRIVEPVQNLCKWNSTESKAKCLWLIIETHTETLTETHAKTLIETHTETCAQDTMHEDQDVEKADPDQMPEEKESSSKEEEDDVGSNMEAFIKVTPRCSGSPPFSFWGKSPKVQHGIM